MKGKERKTFIRYAGSKTLLAKWIISHFPYRHDTYIETHGGSGVVLMNKDRSGIETYNDLSGDLVHLFRTLRDHQDELIERIKFTLWGIDELKLSLKPTDDPIERARRFYVQLWLARYPFDVPPTFRRQKIYVRDARGRDIMRVNAQKWRQDDRLTLAAERMRGVQIERMDARKLIELYDYERALFYVDPPYVPETRMRRSHYKLEMTVEDHEALADTLTAVKGMAVLSGYKSDLYKRLYEDRGWKRVQKKARVDSAEGTRIESLYLNPAVSYWLTAERPQLALFKGM